MKGISRYPPLPWHKIKYCEGRQLSGVVIDSSVGVVIDSRVVIDSSVRPKAPQPPQVREWQDQSWYNVQLKCRWNKAVKMVECWKAEAASRYPTLLGFSKMIIDKIVLYTYNELTSGGNLVACNYTGCLETWGRLHPDHGRLLGQPELRICAQWRVLGQHTCAVC